MDNIRNKITSIKKINSFDELESELKREECLSMCPPELFDFLDTAVPALISKGIAGDYAEAGVWKGGTAMYMKYLQKKHGLQNKLWLFDTFDGFPVTPPESDQKDLSMFNFFLTLEITAPSLEEVKQNFSGMDLLDNNIQFIKGNVLETLPETPIQQLALLFLDIDFAELTNACLEHLYPKLQPGGLIIIDDYGVNEFNCKDAVDNYRKQNSISGKIEYINDRIIYWYK